MHFFEDEFLIVLQGEVKLALDGRGKVGFAESACLHDDKIIMPINIYDNITSDMASTQHFKLLYLRSHERVTQRLFY
jgi:hypothetical protein